MSGCFRQVVPSQPTDSEKALFTANDLQRAKKVLATSVEGIRGSDLDNPVTDTDPPSEDTSLEGDLTSQAILPGVDGFVVYIRSDGTTYQIWSHNQTSDAKVLVYEGPYEIQSVAISGDGQTVLAVIKAPIVNNFEVYRFKLETSSTELLTNTATQEEDVSMNAVGNVLVWEGENSANGLRAVFIRDYSNDTTFTQSILTFNTANQVDPSVSANGTYIALIRELTSDRVLLYNRGTSTYTTIANRSNPVFDPSASDDGTRVIFLEKTATMHYIRVKNLTTGVLSTEVASATPLAHPHLKGSGTHLSYGREGAGFTRLYTRDLASNAQAVNAGGSWNHFGMYWQQPQLAQVTIETQQPLGTTDFSYTSATGEEITMPGTQETNIIVAAGVDETSPAPISNEIERLTRAINFKIEGDPNWTSSQVIQLSAPATNTAALRSQATTSYPLWACALIDSQGNIIEGTYEFAQYDASTNSYIGVPNYYTLEAVEALGYNLDDLTFSCQVVLVNKEAYRPSQPGLYAVETAVIQSMLVKKEFCDNPSNLSYLLDYLINDNNTIVTPYTPTHDTAIIMIHGWQRLDDIIKGDEPSKNAAHCKAWFNVMKAFQHKSGDWSTLKASTDLFTFRYDSDDRISNNGIKLSLAIEKLRDTYGYQNVILLGHSMGGLVSVDARTKIAGTNPIRGIVTLATPFMGGPIECTLQSSGFCIAITSINLSDLGNPRMLALKTLAHIIDLNSPDEGTKDLTSYYGNTPNPYLTNLWSNPDNFNNVYALYGLNSANTFTPTFAIGEAALVLGWGRSDGVVPYSSAVGSATLQLSGTPTPAPNLNAQPSVSRDHNQFTGGCTPCTSNGYDPYYDKVALGLKSFLPGPNEPVWFIPAHTGEGGGGITRDSNNNLYISGARYTSSNRYDAFVAKYTSRGIRLWFQQFGTSDDDLAYRITSDSSGNIYVVGVTDGVFPNISGSGDQDTFIAKYSSNGTQVWLKQFGTSGYDSVGGIITDSSGNVYITGTTRGTFPNNTSAGGDDAFIAKYTSIGTQVWVKQFGTSFFDGASAIIADSNSGLYVSGRTSGDAYIAKYTNDGNQLWFEQFGTSNTDAANGITTDSSGNLYVTGSTRGAFPNNTNLGVTDAFVAKYSSSGTRAWIKQFGTTADDDSWSITINSSGVLYVSGYTNSTFPNNTSSGRGDAFIAKYNSSGTRIWVKQFGTSGYDGASSIITDSNNNVYIEGPAGSLPGNGGYQFIAKFLPD